MPHQALAERYPAGLGFRHRKGLILIGGAMPHRNFDSNTPSDRCACLCSLWKHIDICTNKGEVQITLAGGFTEESTFIVCRNCSDSICQRHLRNYDYDKNVKT